MLPISMLVAVLVAIVTTHVNADPVDAFMQREMRSQNIPGASVGVVRHGKLIKAAGYGFSNLELGTSAGPKTVYQLASMTKQFTAVAVVMLNDKGKLGYRALAAFPLEFTPGQKWSYSNSNYLLLGLIIQKMSGKPWDAFLAEHVFRPLGMSATRRDVPADIIPGRAAPRADVQLGRVSWKGRLSLRVRLVPE